MNELPLNRCKKNGNDTQYLPPYRALSRLGLHGYSGILFGPG